MSVLNRLSAMAESAGGVAELATPLLKVAGLCHAFGGQQVLKDVDLELRRGEVVLLRGANGSGKTTLLNILTGNLVPDRGSIELHTRREPVRFEFPLAWGRRGFSPEGLARLGLGRTWQDIRLFESRSLLENVAVATPGQLGENPLWAVLRRGAVNRQEDRVRRGAQARLVDLGLGDRSGSGGDRVSLGQSKRVAIGRSMQAGAKILFLDEPLVGLDGTGVEEVMGLLRGLARDEGVTLVIVEHVFNLRRVLDLATTVWTLEGGKILVESAEVVRSQPVAVAAGGVEDWLAGLGGEMVTTGLPGGAVLKVVRVPGVAIGDVVLKVKDLVVCRGKRLVVDGLSFELRRGELGVLLAPNGWGKTTLLEALMGLVGIDRGSIEAGKEVIHTMNVWERVTKGISFLQSRDNLFPTLSVKEVLQLSHITKIPTNIMDLVDKRMTDLSGGERQRLLASCTFDSPPFNIVLLDEPFSALDSDSTALVQSYMLDSLSRAGILIAEPQQLQTIQMENSPLLV